MKQLMQRLRSGEVLVQEVPPPSLQDTFVKIATRRSVISVGTERAKVLLGDQNLLAKARARPDLVRKVLDEARRNGMWATIEKVRNRLEAAVPLGYSAAGIALEVGTDVRGVRPGDRVAVGGAGYANHAEVLVVPHTLVVPVPPEVGWDDAAFTTVGAIALQGIRVAAPSIGETFLVLGLGLIGQLTIQLLLANGCRVLAFDPIDNLTDRAAAAGAEAIRSGEHLVQAIHNLTNGMGVDGVLITATTPSSEPVEVAGEVTREKGRVVVVGSVGMTVPREPYYQKEIAFHISRSYGPGRYDHEYEEAGHDYPYGYVRFTEQRNMMTFIRLLAGKRIDPKPLITHHFPITDAARAYDLLRGGPDGSCLAIVLDYPESTPSREPLAIAPRRPANGATVGVSFAGAGNYATGTLLPILRRLTPPLELRGICTASGLRARDVGERFGFRFCSMELSELFEPETYVLFVASPDHTHAQIAVEALAAGKHVYVEKPLCVTREQLSSLVEVASVAPGHLFVGFNRRFAPLTQQAREFLAAASGPVLVTIRINAGPIGKGDWVERPDIGYGRVISEACHFVDLAALLCGAPPARVAARAITSERPPRFADNVAIRLTMTNGSVADIIYTSAGGRAMPKERIEAFCGGRSIVIDDFRTAMLFGSRDSKRISGRHQDKGQVAMLRCFFASLLQPSPLQPLDDLAAVSKATIAAVESIAHGQEIPLVGP
jgi:predicted dehydrogenase/threonine dehydrogenase-like Zn-dependent dehydrogenase